MWIVAFVAVLVGPSLLPDETDFRVLGAMPVTRPVVFGAKLSALVLFIGLFVAASEAALLPMFTVTTISPHRRARVHRAAGRLSRHRRPGRTVRCAVSDGGAGAASAARAAPDAADGVCGDWQPDAVRAGRRCAAGRPRAVVCAGVLVGLAMAARVSAGLVRGPRAMAPRRITVRRRSRSPRPARSSWRHDRGRCVPGAVPALRSRDDPPGPRRRRPRSPSARAAPVACSAGRRSRPCGHSRGSRCGGARCIRACSSPSRRSAWRSS